MGIDDLDKTWWERKVRPSIQESDFAENHPLIAGMGDYIGGGISDFFTQKTPDLGKHYLSNESYKGEPIVDLAKEAGNVGYEVANYGSDLALNALTQAQHLPAQIYNLNATLGNALTDWTGIDSLHTDMLPGHGWGGAGTYLQDTLSDATGGFLGKPTDMRLEPEKYYNSYSAPMVEIDTVDDGKQKITDTDLSNWTAYQAWKTGSGKDIRAIEREAIKNSTTDFNKWVKNEGSVDKLMNDFNEVWWDDLTADEQSLYDKSASFTSYHNDRLQQERNLLKNMHEFKQTGEDYGKWASKKYQDDMIQKYGRYQLHDDINLMSGSLAPWQFGDVKSEFNLANEDYIKAMRGGKDMSQIGDPTEFDFGIFDRESGVGINKWADWQPFEHESDEAKAYYESGPVAAAELLLGGRFLQAPQKLTQALSKGKKGRILREISPGLFQNQAGWGLGMPKNFGFGKFKNDRWWKRAANRTTGAVDWMRPKGGQAGLGMAGGERELDR